MTARTLYGRFAATVASFPDHLALEVGDVALTYAQLDRAAAHMAERMRGAVGGTPTRVGLLTTRRPASYVSYLAALRLGAIVVPQNPLAPAGRNLDIAAEAGIDLTVIDETSGDAADDYRNSPDLQVLDVSGYDACAPARCPAERPPVVTGGGDDIAYTIFTSGTTGKPKGVPITNESIDAYLSDIVDRYGLGPGCRVSQMFEMCFDASIMEIFGSWASGATLCVPSEAEVFTPVRYVNAKRLTHWMSVPSVVSFARQLRGLTPGSMPTLRRSVFGGETLTVEQAAAWSAAAPNAVLHNCYGPTELTVFMADYRLPVDTADWPETSNRSIPIGEVFPGMDWILLDEQLHPSADDGELCVRGVQRFPGYLDPGQNTRRFVSVTDRRGHLHDGSRPLAATDFYRTGDRCRVENGMLVHLGRIDNQVKIRGHRIELGEIESVLRRHPDVVTAVVVALTAVDGQIELHAAYTGEQVPDTEFTALLATLPGYMRPQRIRHRESIPVTPVGKVDRNRLAAEFASADL
ncbi:AMP-binding protein [Micromonospora sp. CA-259024]|uniref:AMP-binding protein n=1 Tax=Micromonospora sp. CA-259024 TaxID=3239965 RepID=UPI003D935DCB